MRRVSLLLALAFMLTACSAAPTATPFPYVQLAPEAPPEAPFEPTPLPDAPTSYVWRPGYWAYDGYRYAWVPGEFLLRPSPTAVWSAARWEPHDYGWGFVPGHWQ